jgi:type VI secretion system secreted protein VgrG
MANYVQADRDLTVSTPLGDDVLLLRGFTGRESISRPFHFKLDLAAINDTVVPFENLLGQRVTAHLGLADDEKRHFSGTCNRVSEGHRDATFTYYQIEIVPQFWLLKLKSQSRIFQQMSVPDILEQVLQGLDVVYQIRGTFEPRDYCVQYDESDFNFASRLMEEEGIYYFFTHSSDGHQMVVANTPQSHPELGDPAPVVFETSEVGDRQAGRITRWRKRQSLRSGQFTLRDHCFELPDDPLAVSKTIPASVPAGQVEHRLRVGPTERLEVYDYPGAFAQRFDGIDPSGGDRSEDLGYISDDGSRTVEIRMQESTVPSLVISGAGHCRYLASGSKFMLTGHPNGDGSYVLLSVRHEAKLGGDYRSSMGLEVSYRNSFQCMPSGLTFRPPRVARKPVVQGTQTAVVVGPAGEEIFTDKYGRVKVQFFWDRDGKKNENSSCWIRVGSAWASKQWGAIHIPRVGQEVIVTFEEGDPDQPIIIGCVYNSARMPPYLLPKRKMVSGTKSNSYPGGGGYNEFVMDDSKSKELIRLHAQRDMDATVENDSRELVVHNRHMIVGKEPGSSDGGDLREDIYYDRHEHVRNNRVEHVEGDVHLTVGKGQADGGNVNVLIGQTKKELIEGDSHEHVKGARAEQVDGSSAMSVGGDRAESVGGTEHFQVRGDRNEKVNGTQSLTVVMNQQESVGQNHALAAGMEIHLKAGMKVVIEAGLQLTLKGPGGFVDIGPAGVAIQGTMVLINSGGAAGSGSDSSPTGPTAPQAPQDAAPDRPTTPDKAGLFTT